VDIYYHSWDPSCIHNPRGDELSVDVAVEDIEEFLPDATGVIDSQQDFDSSLKIEQYLSNNPMRRMTRDDLEARHTLLNFFRSLESLQRAHQYFLRTKKRDYARIIVTRSDLNFLNIPKDIPRSIGKQDIIVPDFHHWGGVNDRFAICSEASCKIYCDRLSQAKDWCLSNRRDAINSEQFLKQVLLSKGIEIHKIDLLLQRVRATGEICKLDRNLAPKSITNSHLILNDYQKMKPQQTKNCVASSLSNTAPIGDYATSFLTDSQLSQVQHRHATCAACSQSQQINNLAVQCSAIDGESVSLLNGRCKLRKWQRSVSEFEKHKKAGSTDESKCFIVLGMHRSATSLMAKSLHQGGVYMGNKLIPADRGNPKGYFENIEIVRLNDAILSAAGGSWIKPPSHEDIMATDFSEQIQEMLEKYRRPLWGWKDPRSLLTIEKYLPYIKNPHFVCCFRPPDSVAKSLYTREGERLPYKKGLALAKEYNKRLLTFLHSYGGGELWM
jgi:hypothetical protein